MRCHRIGFGKRSSARQQEHIPRTGRTILTRGHIERGLGTYIRHQIVDRLGPFDLTVWANTFKFITDPHTDPPIILDEPPKEPIKGILQKRQDIHTFILMVADWIAGFARVQWREPCS